jgi:hypothetical protein
MKNVAITTILLERGVQVVNLGADVRVMESNYFDAYTHLEITDGAPLILVCPEGMPPNLRDAIKRGSAKRKTKAPSS